MQSVVALSSGEAEFMELATCDMECLYLSKLMNGLLSADVRSDSRR